MNCQDAREHFSALLDASIGLTEWVPLEAHLRRCEACQHELEALRTSERPRPPLRRPNLTLDFVSKAFQGIRPADLMDRLRQRVFPSNRVMRRVRPRPDLFGKMLDVLRPADRTSPRRRRVYARRRITWRPKLGADLVRKALEATRRLDVVTRRHRIVPSLAPVARRALKTIRPLAVATWRRRRVFLHVKVRHLRLTTTVILVALGAVGLFRYRAEVDIAIRHWVPSAPSSGDGPPPTKMASTEPATRPEIPPVSPPATPVPAPPALSPSPAPPAPQKPYLAKDNLGSLHPRLAETAVLSSRVLDSIKVVKDLRNVVAHRHGTYGVTEAETPQGRPMGMYKGGQVFRQASALQTLVEDVTDATSALIGAAHRFKQQNEAMGELGASPESF